MGRPKILFLQRHPFPYFGIMSISAVLKKYELRTDVLIDSMEKDILKKICEISPDIAAFSVISTDHKWMIELSAKIKHCRDTPIVVGGVHASACPEIIIKDPSIDHVIIGEGEYIFPQLIENLLGRRAKKTIDGVISKDTKGEPHYVAGNLIEDLDALPFEDRSIYYDRYPSLRSLPLKQFISGRGCPFDCSFCFNAPYRNMLKGKGKYVRRKSPEYFIKEIKDAENQYGAQSLFFADDLFAMDLKWLSRFADRASKETLPGFMCTAMANLMTEDIARLLKKSGCRCVTFGIETGNEYKRNTILNKNVSDEDIKNCAKILKRNNIKVQTSNIFAFPGETIDDAFQTIRLNVQIGTDCMFSTLMMPLPKTRIEEIAKRQNMLPRGYDCTMLPASFHSKSIFNFKDVEILQNIHKISYIAMKLPKYEKLFRWLVTKKCDRLFFILFAFSFIYRYKTERDISFFSALKTVWDFRKSY